MRQQVFIYSMKRTAIGKTHGLHKDTLPEVLMANVLTAVLYNGHGGQKLDTAVEECLLANAVGPMGNMARLSWLTAGLPISTPATTVDFQCGGSLKALQLAHGLIASNSAKALVVGGMESTSLEPQRHYHPRDPRKSLYPGVLLRAQFAPFELGDVDMLQGAENTAYHYGLTREVLDDYALLSHQRALEAQSRGIFDPFLVPPRTTLGDESLRPTISHRLLSRAKPLLGPKCVTTAGNACLMHDGAAAVVIGNREFGLDYKLEPLAEIMDFASVGVEPTYSPLGATLALQALAERSSFALGALDHFEINEAFAAKILAFHKITGISLDKVNPNGGALAYGHPYSASGIIYLIHLVAGLRARGGGIGAISLGVAGGQGIAARIRAL